MLASIGEDRTVRLWQPTIGRMVRFARLTSPPLAVAWTPDGTVVVVSGIDGHVRRIDPETVTVIDETHAIDGWAHAIAIGPRNEGLVVGGPHGRVVRVPAN